MADMEDRGPTGMATERPTMADPATIGLLMKIGADAVAGLKGGKELLASLKSTDLSAIAIEDAKYDEEGDYVVSLKFTNASGHGADVEKITITQKQQIDVRITPTPGSWVTRDAYGQLEVIVRPLNTEADDPKHLTFAIRQRPNS
jgi:hypothetical protein